METVQHKCPNCGADVVLNPQTGRFVCSFCSSDFTAEELNAHSEAHQRTQADDNFSEHTRLYVCSSCGAEIVADENTAASFCHYCHSPVTLKGRVEGAYAPELIIPFKIDRETAIAEFRKWCGKKLFIQSSFRSEAQLEKLVGLYVPFWLADCDIDTSADYDARIVHSYTSGDYRMTHTKYYDVSRAARMTYTGVPADGSKKLDDKLMDSIEPFFYDGAVPFDMTWFSGFYADKYDVDKAAVVSRIKARIESGATDFLDSSVTGYTSKRCTKRTIRITRTDWHYAMLPVWFMTYIHKGKKYFFALNGQTGKISGILPVSAPKLALLGTAITALFVLIGLFG